MLTKLRINNEEEMIDFYQCESDGIYVHFLKKLSIKIEIDNVVFLSFEDDVTGLGSFDFNGYDKKTNTYFYKFSRKDF